MFAPGAFDSGRERANSNLIGSSLRSNRIGGFCSVPNFSTHSSLVLRDGMFSSPDVRLMPAKGDALPWSVDSANARRGLFEAARVRGDDLKGALRRNVNLFLAVAGAGVAVGESEVVSFTGFGLKARASARGEMGEPGELLLPVRSWKREGFEGERDSERRSCCTEENPARW